MMAGAIFCNFRSESALDEDRKLRSPDTIKNKYSNYNTILNYEKIVTYSYVHGGTS